MTVVARTAEWICTRCGTTNRALVPMSRQQMLDRCVSCKTRHLITENDRPVRWDAKLAG
ncbi:MAG: hypothetical protein AB7I33_15490 [Gemmatimonadales bacterium]